MILSDLLRPGLLVVFCGSAAGRVSKERQAYYAGPGNRFWPSLHAAGLTPRRFAPADYPELLALGIGLTDVCKTGFGNDVEITMTAEDRARLIATIGRLSPRLLAFTSKAAAAAALGSRTRDLGYGAQGVIWGETQLFVLPSPSGSARTFWTIEPWMELGRRVAALRQSPASRVSSTEQSRRRGVRRSDGS